MANGLITICVYKIIVSLKQTRMYCGYFRTASYCGISQTGCIGNEWI